MIIFILFSKGYISQTCSFVREVFKKSWFRVIRSRVENSLWAFVCLLLSHSSLS